MLGSTIGIIVAQKTTRCEWFDVVGCRRIIVLETNYVRTDKWVVLRTRTQQGNVFNNIILYFDQCINWDGTTHDLALRKHGVATVVDFH